MTVEEILADFPDLEADDIAEAGATPRRPCVSVNCRCAR
jgi:hypothetical protein